MGMATKFDWAGKLNIAAACLSFSFICATVAGVL